MPQWSVGSAALNMNGCKRVANLGASDGRCESLCDVLQFCSPTSLQSRFATCFNKNNLSGTVELVDHYTRSGVEVEWFFDKKGNISTVYPVRGQ